MQQTDGDGKCLGNPIMAGVTSVGLLQREAEEGSIPHKTMDRRVFPD
jgi:hypothetical protein